MMKATTVQEVNGLTTIEAVYAPSTALAELEGHLRVPFHPRSASVARRQLRLWLSRHVPQGPSEEFEEFVYCAELVVSELVGNAIVHALPVAGDVLDLRWVLGEDGLDVAVTDGGSALVPHKVDAPLQSPGGRGLAIIDAVSERWWTEGTADVATVHAVIARSC